MKIEIIGRDYNITEGIRNFIHQRFDFLEKFVEDGDVVYITLSKEGDLQEVSVQINYMGSLLKITEHHSDLYQAIDLLKDRLFVDLTRRKQMVIERKRSQTRSMKTMNDYNELLKSRETPEEIVKEKTFYLKPMFVEEAILQMDMLGHSFFVFLDADTMEQNVLYKRKDGKYGIIQTKLG